jgi:hypothetical protein
VARPRNEPDWLIDAEIALYRSRGWEWEAIAAYFGMSESAARKRCRRIEQERKEDAWKRKTTARS